VVRSEKENAQGAAKRVKMSLKIKGIKGGEIGSKPGIPQEEEREAIQKLNVHKRKYLYKEHVYKILS